MIARVHLAGAGVLAVAMGFGRFAYTPLLVVMRHDAGLGVALSGVLASVNLAGYLAGALVATHRAVRARRYAALCVAAIAVALLTGAMALPQPYWIPVRFFTGLASGVAFVLTVSLILDRAREGTAGIALVFSGVGLGIASAGVLVPALAAHGGSRAAWLGIAAVCSAILVAALPALRDEPTTHTRPIPARSSAAANDVTFAWLCAAYGLEGFAYIIPATFLVTMVNEAPDVARYSASTWVVVGLVAAPGAATWAAIASKTGRANAFVLALIVQGAGLLAAVLVPGVGGALALAVTLGSTFVGITSLASAIARDLRPHATNVAIGLLTVTYGVGQIVGPLVAVRISLATGTYRESLELACGATLVGAFAYALQARKGRATAA